MSADSNNCIVPLQTRNNFPLTVFSMIQRQLVSDYSTINMRVLIAELKLKYAEVSDGNLTPSQDRCTDSCDEAPESGRLQGRVFDEFSLRVNRY